MSTNDELTTEEVLDITRRARVDMVQEMIKDGPPNNNKDRRTLNEIINGAETTELGLLRINNETNDAKANRAIAQEALRIERERGNINPFTKSALVEAGKTVPNHSIDEGDLNIEEGVIIEGEMDLGVSDLTYDEFIARNKPDRDDDD